MTKKLSCLVLVALLTLQGALFAQQYTLTVTTSVANNIPLNDGTNNRRQNLYLPADFPTAPSGAITKLYYKPNAAGTYNFTNLSINMGTTALANFATGPWAAGLTPVYTGTGAFPTNAGGWIEIPLTTPFLYNNTQNFIVDVSQAGFAPGFAAVTDGSATSTNRTMYGNALAATGTQQTRLMQLGFDIQTSCDSPINIQFSNRTTSGVNIGWSNMPGAIGYEYVIDQNRTNPLSLGYATVTAPALSLTNLPDGTCYYVHLRTNCSGLYPLSGWALDSFCTIKDCEIPEVTIESITGTTAIARWNAVPGVLSYEYSVGTTPDTPVQGHNTTYTNVKLMGLTPNKPLYFYLKAKCTETPESPWGVTPFHTEAGTSVDDAENNPVSIYAFPNPVKDVVTLEVTGAPGANPVARLTDVTGKLIEQKTIQGNKTTFNTSGLAPGLYYAEYSDDAYKKVIKINKQ